MLDGGDRGTVTVAGRLDASGYRPGQTGGDIAVTGSAPAASPDPGRLWIDGLLIEGKITAPAGNLSRLSLSHSTVFPGGGLRANANPALEVTLYRSICGPVALDTSVPSLTVVVRNVDLQGMLRGKRVLAATHGAVNAGIPGKLHAAVVIPVVWVALPVTW